MKRILPLAIVMALLAVAFLLRPSAPVVNPAQALTERDPIPSYEVLSIEPLEDGRIIFRVGER